MLRLALSLVVLALLPAAADAAVVSQYHLDGSYADSSGFGATGTSPTGAFTADGRWGSAFQASATGQGFDVASAPRIEPAGAVTMAVWVRRATRAGSERIIAGKLSSGCGGITYGFRTTEEESAPVFSVAARDGGGASVGRGAVDRTVDVWDGRWHALAGTFDGREVRLYVDGSLRSTVAIPGAPATLDYASSGTDRRLQVARHTLPGQPACNPADLQYNGDLDELRVYDTALTAAQVGRLQDPAATSPPTSLDPPPTPTPTPTAVPTPRPPAPQPTGPTVPSLSAVNRTLPAITKTSKVNASTTRYSCSPGTWTGLAAAPGYTYSWLRSKNATAGGVPGAQAQVTTGPTLDVGTSGAGFTYVCRVTVLAASGQRVSATSPSLVLYGTFATNPDPVPQRIVGNVTIRGIDVFQAVQPTAGSLKYGLAGAAFPTGCGGGTPTSYTPDFLCLFGSSGDLQAAGYRGVDLDHAKPAYAVVYVNRAPGSDPVDVDVRLTGRAQGGAEFTGVVRKTLLPLSSPVGTVVTAAERDKEAFGVLIPVPQTWLRQAARLGAGGQLRLDATATVDPAEDVERVQCLALVELCAADDRFTLSQIPVEDGMYALDVRSIQMLKEDQILGASDEHTFPAPESVLASAIELFPGGNELRVQDDDSAIVIDVDRLTATNGCPRGRAGESAEQRTARVRSCRSNHVLNKLLAWRNESVDNRTGYDVLMGIHDYDDEPGLELGTLSPATKGGTQPVMHTDDGTAGRPLTAGAHEFGHTLGAPHADFITQAISKPLACGGNEGGGGERWEPDNRGRLQGTRFYPDTQERRVDGVGSNLLFDLMSYCTGGTDLNAGLSAFNWNRFEQKLLELAKDPPDLSAHAARAHAGATRPGFVTGSLYDGEAVITDVVPADADNGIVSADPSSALRIATTDAAGKSLGETGAKVETPNDAGGGSTFIAPVPKGAAALTVSAGGTVLARQTAGKPPKVRFLSPRRGTRVRRSLTVRWKTRDADSPSRSASVEFNPGGRTWRSLYQGPDTGRIVVRAEQLSAARRARLRVRINDGFNAAQAVSTPFRAAGARPDVRITAPARGARVAGGVATVLAGEATDDAGRAVTGRKLTWFAGKRRLGRGSPLQVTLPSGAPKVRLVARDGRGRAGSAVRRTAVERVPVRITRLQAPARVARKARAVRVSVAASVRGRLKAGGRSYRVGPKARTIEVRLPAKPRTGRLRIPVRMGKLRTTLVLVRL